MSQDFSILFCTLLGRTVKETNGYLGKTDIDRGLFFGFKIEKKRLCKG